MRITETRQLSGWDFFFWLNHHRVKSQQNHLQDIFNKSISHAGNGFADFPDKRFREPRFGCLRKFKRLHELINSRKIRRHIVLVLIGLKSALNLFEGGQQRSLQDALFA
eukprot:m.75027 g.75027  ORF g.75027 m.75027 type:complete len:109 (+) comp13962_c0_seq1:708-1034(+)